MMANTFNVYDNGDDNVHVLPCIQQLSPLLSPILQSNPFFSARVSLPPGVNASYEIVTIRPRGKKPYHTIAATEALKNFKERAGYELKLACCDWQLVQAIRQSKQHVPLAMRLRFFYPTLWKQDIDGGEKAVIDAVFSHLQLNDNLVIEKRTTKGVDRTDPRVEIDLRCILSSK